MICPNCNTTNSSTAHFCGSCSSALGPGIGNPTGLHVPLPILPNLKSIPVRTLLRNKPSLILLFCLLILVSAFLGGIADSVVIHPLFSPLPPNDPSSVNYVSASNTTPPTDVGIIRHVTITDAYTKADTPTGSQYYHCFVRYTIINNPLPQNEAFWDRDYPDIKTNSADVYNLCERYKENSGDPEQGKLVTLIVTGVRNSSQSQFRNILFILPEDQ